MPSLRPQSSVLHATRYLRPPRAVQRPGYVPLGRRNCSRCAPPPYSRRYSITADQKIESLNSTTSELPKPVADHRSAATRHDLFSTSVYSPGSPLLHPNGAAIFNRLIAFLRAQYPQFGFQEVITPIIYKKSLWEVSGHWENYAEDMFAVNGRGATGQTTNAEIGEDEEFGLKPMNCPGHCLLFKTEKRGYRDLPIRFADFGPLHRNEISGALTGLTRVRRFHQDDGHIFCRPNQILQEIEGSLKMVGMVYETFGLGPYKLLLSTRPADHFIGTTEEWDRAEEQLKEALESSGKEWAISEGDGAFYGPKIDIILKDSNGKEHQTATIQLDFQLPQRFGLQYFAPAPELEANGRVQEDTPKELLEQAGPVTPVLIHRAVLGSVERFMALLIEHYDKAYPFWLSPRQAIILSMNQDEEITQHAEKVRNSILNLDPPSSSSTIPRPLSMFNPSLSIDLDLSPRPLGKKVQEARKAGYTFVMVVGKQEVKNNSVSLQLMNYPDHQGREDKREAVVDQIGALLTEGAKSKFPAGLSRGGVELQTGNIRPLFVGLMEKYL